MAKLIDDIIADLPLSPRGQMARLKVQSNRLLTNRSQGLSEVEKRVLPWKYRNLYEIIKRRDPVEAEKFFNDWSIDPTPKPVDKYELEKKALAKLGQPTKSNKLRRRV